MAPARKPLTKAQKDAIRLRQNHNCAICGELMSELDEIHYDHEKALHLDGDNSIENYRAVHYRPCHDTKTRAEAAARGKVRRIRTSAGLTKKRPNQRERFLAARKRREEMP